MANKRDIADRVRARTWAAEVARVPALGKAEGLTNAMLDAEFVLKDPVGRPRPIELTKTFDGIRKRGTNPHKPHRGRRFSVVEAVAANPAYAHTRRTYFTPFWRLLMPPAPTISVVSTLIGELLAHLGYFRADDEQAEFGRWLYTVPEIFTERAQPAYSVGLDIIAEVGTLDALALLGALYREASFKLDYERMPTIAKRLDRCFTHLPFRYGLDKELALTLHWLIQERILRNHWEPVEDAAALALARGYFHDSEEIDSEETPSSEVTELARRLRNRSPAYRRPISRLTPELASFLAQSDVHLRTVRSWSIEELCERSLARRFPAGDPS